MRSGNAQRTGCCCCRPLPASAPLNEAVFVLPPPEPGNDVWARLKVATEGALAPANYAIRYDTAGGVRAALLVAAR